MITPQFFWMWCFKEVHPFRPQMSKSKFLKCKKRNGMRLVYLKRCVIQQLGRGEGFLIQERDKWEDGSVLILALDRRQPYGPAVTSYLFRSRFAGLPWIRFWLISQTPSLDPTFISGLYLFISLSTESQNWEESRCHLSYYPKLLQMWPLLIFLRFPLVISVS